MDTMEETREELTNKAVEILGHALASRTFDVTSNYDYLGTPYVSVGYSYAEYDGVDMHRSQRTAFAKIYLGHTHAGGLYVAQIFTEHLCGRIRVVHCRRVTEDCGPMYQTSLMIDDSHSFDYFVRNDIVGRIAIDWPRRLKEDAKEHYKRQTFDFNGESLNWSLK